MRVGQPQTPSDAAASAPRPPPGGYFMPNHSAKRVRPPEEGGLNVSCWPVGPDRYGIGLAWGNLRINWLDTE